MKFIALHYGRKSCKLCTDLSLNDTCNGITFVIIHACHSMKKKMLKNDQESSKLDQSYCFCSYIVCVAFTGSAIHPKVLPTPGTHEGPFPELYSLHSMPQVGTI